MLKSEPIRPLIIGLPGPQIDDETARMIQTLNPAGFILFRRNCKDKAQLEKLCAKLHELSQLEQPLIFIDQEGGRVNRIDWDPYMGPTAAEIGALYDKAPQQGLEAAQLSGYLIAAQLAAYGITVNCAPVADVRQDTAHPIIGDRAFSTDPAAVSALCAATITGMLAGGVWPVIKHAPGHGRAGADSHLALPSVDADLASLEQIDFTPFAANNRCPFVMTAHVAYTAVDGDTCATLSPKVIDGVLRKQLGMDGLIVSDDLFMHALKGPLLERAAQSLHAGCDLLICASTSLQGAFDEGLWQEMETLKALPGLSNKTIARLKALPGLHTPQADTLKDAFEHMQTLIKAA